VEWPLWSGLCEVAFVEWPLWSGLCEVAYATHITKNYLEICYRIQQFVLLVPILCQLNRVKILTLRFL
jgi:hypothetical protein